MRNSNAIRAFNALVTVYGSSKRIPKGMILRMANPANYAKRERKASKATAKA